MTIRISFTLPDRRSGHPRPRQVLRYGLSELGEVIRDWWYLRRAGRSPQLTVSRR